MKTPKILAFVNDKGGVGKTLLSQNISYLLSKSGKKVLLIDLDLQANSTSLYCPNPESIPGVSSIFQEEPELSFLPALVVDELSDTLFISPANSMLDEAIRGAERLTGREYLLRDALEGHDFDYVVLDCPPNPNCLQKDNALSCADEIIIPVKDDINSINGVSGIVKAVSRSNENDPTIRIVVNMLNRSRLSLNRQLEEWIQARSEKVEEFRATAKRAKPFTYIVEEIKIPNAAIAGDAQSNLYPLDIAAGKSSTNQALIELAARF